MFDNEKFILEIESRPTLYNTKMKEYSNKLFKANCWTEVGRVMYENWDIMSTEDQDKAGKDMMKRWKTLRDAFVREFRSVKKVETGVPATKKKRYVFYEQLSFLLPHVKGNENTTSNILPAEDIEYDLEQQQNVDEPEVNLYGNDHNFVNPSTAERKIRQDRTAGKSNLSKTLSSASKSITSLMKESIALQKADNNAEKNSDKFGNKSFLMSMSFVPIMDNLSPYEALDVRMKITEVFMDAARKQSPYNFSHSIQEYNRSSTRPSTPCSSTSNTITTSISMHSEECGRLNLVIDENTIIEPVNISDVVNSGIMPGHEF